MNNNDDEKSKDNNPNLQEKEKNTINKKPKYQYELKIINEPFNIKNKIKSKTPDKIISSINFSIINTSKIELNKQNDINNEEDNIPNYKYNNYINSPQNGAKNSKSLRNYYKDHIIQSSTQFNIFSKVNENFRNNKIIKNYNNNFQFNDYKRNYYEDKDYICHEEFDKIVQDYFYRRKNRKNKKHFYKFNRNMSNITVKKNYNINSKYNYIERNNENNFQFSKRRIKKYFDGPLKIEKSIEKAYLPQNCFTPNNYKRKNINENYDNNVYFESFSFTKNKGNLYDNNIDKSINLNQNLFFENINSQKEPGKIRVNNRNKKFCSNYAFISINDSKNKNINSYNNSQILKNELNPLKIQYQNYINNIDNTRNVYNSPISKEYNNNIVYYSSEKKIRKNSISLVDKLKNLMIKKKIQKPLSKRNKIKDENIINNVKKISKVNSVDEKDQLNDENKFKGYLNNIYKTYNKNSNENGGKKLALNKSQNNITYKDKNIINKIFSKGKIMDKNMKHKSKEKEILPKNKKNIYYKKNNSIYVNKKNNNNKNIRNNFLNNNNFTSSLDYNGIFTNIYEQNEQNNENKLKDDIKYFYYLNNDDNYQSLSDYFLSLNDEKKIKILNNLNDGNNENKKIYMKLINILKEYHKNDNKKKDILNNFINYNNDDKNKKNNKKSNNILFKKKTIVK